jgi:hypothetical protein
MAYSALGDEFMDGETTYRNILDIVDPSFKEVVLSMDKERVMGIIANVDVPNDLDKALMMADVSFSRTMMFIRVTRAMAFICEIMESMFLPLVAACFVAICIWQETAIYIAMGSVFLVDLLLHHAITVFKTKADKAMVIFMALTCWIACEREIMP